MFTYLLLMFTFVSLTPINNTPEFNTYNHNIKNKDY